AAQFKSQQRLGITAYNASVFIENTLVCPSHALKCDLSLWQQSKTPFGNNQLLARMHKRLRCQHSYCRLAPSITSTLPHNSVQSDLDHYVSRCDKLLLLRNQACTSRAVQL